MDDSVKIEGPEYGLGLECEQVLRDLPDWFGIEEALQDEQGVRFVQVKTLAPGSNDPSYAKTRKFYESAGYVALEEFPELWDLHNPCLQMIKAF